MDRISHLTFYVNGSKVNVDTVEPDETLAVFLRKKLRLTGTKIGCNQGGCGACTVMVSKMDRTLDKIRHCAVNACLVPIASVHGHAITTVEGIGSTRTRLHPVQERIAKSHGTQCGYCTPGMVMSMYTLLRNNPQPSESDIEMAIGGNLCRCTGYRPILAGLKSFSKERCCRAATDCCQNSDESKDLPDEPKLFDEKSGWKPIDSTQEPIFPAELQLSDVLDRQSLEFQGRRCTWYRPLSLEELSELRKVHPDGVLVGGFTEIGHEIHQKNTVHPVMISLSHVPELHRVRITEIGVEIGACTNVTDFISVLDEIIDSNTDEKTQFMLGVLSLMKEHSSTQIRNTSTIGGNIIMALRNFSISDVSTCLTGCRSKLTFLQKDGTEATFIMDSDLFDDKKRKIQTDEILVKITIPFSNKNDFFKTYKQAKRSSFDFAIVNSAMKVTFVESSGTIDDLRLAFGGVSKRTFVSKRASEFSGRQWDESLVSDVGRVLQEELDEQGIAMKDYKIILMKSFFFKFYMEVQYKHHTDPTLTVSSMDSSAFREETVAPSRGTQVFEDIPISQPTVDSVGRPIPHKASSQHATGEAVYVDDLVGARDELHLHFVRSTSAHALIKHVDPSEALTMPCVVGFISHEDIPDGRNKATFPAYDVELLASKEVHCVGQAIGAIVADTADNARRAATKVTVTYEEKTPLLDLKEAIAKESFYGTPLTIACGDVDQNWTECDHVFEGEVSMGNQEHFYMETHAIIVTPRGEDGEVDIIAGSQCLNTIQTEVSSVLEVPKNKVVVRAKRVGGGFGGKEKYNVDLCCVAALAAKKTNRPVRCVLDRAEDMAVTGCRIDFLGYYKIGLAKDGKILCYDSTLYGHQGYREDFGRIIMENSVIKSEGLYKIPNFRVTGRLVRTNRLQSTPFRGLGTSEAQLVLESSVYRASHSMGIPFEKVQHLNLYREGDSTPFGMVLENCNIRQCWTECLRRSDYENRIKAVDDFNRTNRWRKRGLAFVPVKHCVGYHHRFVNQAGCLIQVYTDGSVLLSHAGVEIGQGLHTKMIQVASRALEIPDDFIHIAETSLDKVPNTTGTVGSTTADLNGMAILNACKVIKDRLQPYKDANPEGTWNNWVVAAYFDKVSLSTTGFYSGHETWFDWETGRGQPYFYYTYGVGCSEVEIDCLTGGHRLLRTDIVMDVGKSLNPAIDIGQIEGGFMQGYGGCTMEKVEFTEDGRVKSNGPNNYKIPTVAQIPRELNVTLLKNVPNPKAVYSSKGVGEPPFHLGLSVFFAIKKAVAAARADSGLGVGDFDLKCPATVEEVRMACGDTFSRV